MMLVPATGGVSGRGEPARRIVMLVMLLGAFAALVIAGSSDLAADASDTTADETAARNTLVAYHIALTSGDIEEIEKLVVADQRFTMVEGKHRNLGWADYRDNHLAGELADLQKVDLTLDIREIHIDGDLAFASFTFAVSPKGNPGQNYGVSRATAILVRENGGWLIRLMHTS